MTAISRLKEEQTALRAQRKRVQADLRKAEKRRSRLRAEARQLIDADLVTVLQMRSELKKSEEQTGNEKKVTVQTPSKTKAGDKLEGAE